MKTTVPWNPLILGSGVQRDLLGFGVSPCLPIHPLQGILIFLEGHCCFTDHSRVTTGSVCFENSF